MVCILTFLKPGNRVLSWFFANAVRADFGKAAEAALVSNGDGSGCGPTVRLNKSDNCFGMPRRVRGFQLDLHSHAIHRWMFDALSAVAYGAKAIYVRTWARSLPRGRPVFASK